MDRTPETTKGRELSVEKRNVKDSVELHEESPEQNEIGLSRKRERDIARHEQQRVQQHQRRESETPRGKQREDQDRFQQQRRRASETPEFMRGASGAEYTFVTTIYCPTCL